jgi:hypothetical protein
MVILCFCIVKSGLHLRQLQAAERLFLLEQVAQSWTHPDVWRNGREAFYDAEMHNRGSAIGRYFSVMGTSWILLSFLNIV